MNISGQEVIETEGGNWVIHIKSIFKSAGMIYKFPNNSSGIGINKEIVECANNKGILLVITIGDSQHKYIISPKTILEYIRDYGSIYRSEGRPDLYVVSLKELKPITQGTD